MSATALLAITTAPAANKATCFMRRLPHARSRRNAVSSPRAMARTRKKNRYFGIHSHHQATNRVMRKIAKNAAPKFSTSRCRRVDAEPNGERCRGKAERLIQVLDVVGLKR